MLLRCLLTVLLHLGNARAISETLADPLVVNTLIILDLVSSPPSVFFIPDRYARASRAALDLFNVTDRVNWMLTIYS